MKLRIETDLGLSLAKAIFEHNADLLHSLIQANPSRTGLFANQFHRLEPLLSLGDKEWFRQEIGGSGQGSRGAGEQGGNLSFQVDGVSQNFEGENQVFNSSQISINNSPLPPCPPAPLPSSPLPSDTLISIAQLAIILKVDEAIIWEYLAVSPHPIYMFIGSRHCGVAFADVLGLALGLTVYLCDREIAGYNQQLLSILRS